MRDSEFIPKPRKCLIINFARLGDLIQTTPALFGLKNEHPDNWITFVTTESFGNVVKYLPGIDEVELVDLDWIIKVLSHDLTQFKSVWEYINQLVQKFKQRNYDFSANLSSMGVSSILLKLVGSKYQRGWISDDEGFRVLNSRWSRLLSSMLSGSNRFYNSFNVVEYFRMMCEVKNAPQKPVLQNLDKALDEGAKLLSSVGVNPLDKFIVVHPGVSQMKRSWRAEHFSSFIKKFISKTGWKVILTGSGNEVLLTKVLCQDVAHPNCIDLGGRTNLESLIGVISESNGILTGDTGPLHISAALEKPSVSLFVASGWPYETGPYLKNQVIIRPIISCGPCSPNGFCSTLECHDLIPVDTLVELVISHFQGEVSKLEKISDEFKSCFVYLTGFDEFGFYNLTQLNSVYDPHSFLRACYRALILNEFEEVGWIEESESCFDESCYELLKLARLAKELSSKLILSLSRMDDQMFDLSDRLENIDSQILEIANESETVGLLARLYLFERESIVGDAFELAQKTHQNYVDLERRILKLNSLINCNKKDSLRILN